MKKQEVTTAYGTTCPINEAIYIVRKDGRYPMATMEDAKRLQAEAAKQGYNFGITCTTLSGI